MVNAKKLHFEVVDYGHHAFMLGKEVNYFKNVLKFLEE